MDIIDIFLDKVRKNRKTIYCIGDMMVDEYCEVKVDRISPEWPVPVMKLNSEVPPLSVPGGVANVCYQYKHFNVNSCLISLNDFTHNVFDCFKSLNGCYSLKECNPDAHIPIKRRFVENGLQVAPRLDIEKPMYGLSPKDLFHTCSNHFHKIKKWNNPDVAILSDYDKGFFSSDICSSKFKWNKDIAKDFKRGIYTFKNSDHSCNPSPKTWLKRFANSITIVDPKRGPASSWQGCKVFKPNFKEAQEMTGSTDPWEQVKKLSEMLPGSQIVVTRGGEGVIGWDGKKNFEHKPSKKIKTESVVGAGDCFVSMLGLALAHDFSLQESVEIAYRAGEVYVQNRLNRPIIPAEMATRKIVNPEDLVNRDFKLVFTNGCFDLIHDGHISSLDFAKSKGDKLVVALNSDASVKRLKGDSRPVNSLERRMNTISRLDMVDFVMWFEEDTPLNLIQRCKPDVLVKSSQYNLDNTVGSNIVPEVHFCPHLDGYSTTSIINSLKF